MVCWLTGCIDVNDLLVLSSCGGHHYPGCTSHRFNPDLYKDKKKKHWEFQVFSSMFFLLHWSLAQSFCTTKYRSIASKEKIETLNDAWHINPLFYIEWGLRATFSTHVSSWGISLRVGYIEEKRSCIPVSTCYINSRNDEVQGDIYSNYYHHHVSIEHFPLLLQWSVKLVVAFPAISGSFLMAVHQTVGMRVRSFWPWFANNFTPL